MAKIHVLLNPKTTLLLFITIIVAASASLYHGGKMMGGRQRLLCHVKLRCNSSALFPRKKCQFINNRCFFRARHISITTTAFTSFSLPTQTHAIRSTSSLSSSSSSTKSSSTPLYNPADLFDGKIPYPKALSPSAANEFKACPQSYLFQYLYGIREKPNAALAKGSLCHKALEHVFDLHPSQRTLENLQNLFRKEWKVERVSTYAHLFEIEEEEGEEEKKWDAQAEREWGKSSLHLLKNYMEIEDPRNIPKPNPLEREMWVSSKLTVNPKDGVTGYASHDNYLKDKEEDDTLSDLSPTFLVRGIVDRIDMIRMPNDDDDDDDTTENNIVLRIVDYKTGKAPNFKYSPSMNEKIAHDNFWQLKIYALLVREMVASGKGPKNLLIDGLHLRMLRLLYLTSDDDVGVYLDMDLGKTVEERDGVLQEVHADLSGIWKDICELVRKQDARAFVHCDRPFCSCHRVRPNFVRGTVWERESP
uniref:PD-(D/E)XK endonuclease-like domain-containing protein n=2 Tax=Ditylum brightwellii TaxID=49249 RepID=A0A7S2EMZ8_9STRA|mmetsp:Transcript_36035/g.53743  ORF Transcript_36035/g.53743 Transcript_36035/m.53743 type:complete len:475 (+) Transcript_36035:220-1644(+)